MNICSPFVSIKSRLDLKLEEIEILCTNKDIYRAKLRTVDNPYCDSDKIKIIDMKNKGFKDKEITQELNKSYWSITDNIRIIIKENRF